MNCLCCGRPMRTDSEIGWHAGCVKRFFGTSSLPEIDLSPEKLHLIAGETVNGGFTVPGVQKKMSLHLSLDNRRPRLTIVGFPTGYILKPQVEEYPYMPESEHLVMSMADMCGIATVPHALIRDGGRIAYITRRVDRIAQKDHTARLAMEDFCQLDLRLTQDKYRGSYERCARIIDRYSSRSKLDKTELFIRLVFCFITGNSDMHLKNFSLLETGEGSGEYILSPAYDLLAVNLLMPEDKKEFALAMNGEKANLRKSDFIRFAETAGISKGAAEKMIRMLTGKRDRLFELNDGSLLPDDMKADFAELMSSRLAVLAR